MKRRNDYFFKEKEYFKLKDQYHDTFGRKSEWLILDKPVHNGYLLKLELRDDISRREDSWIYQYIVDNFTTTVFSKTKDFAPKYSKRYRRRKYAYKQELPGFRDINKKTFDSLPRKIQDCYRFSRSVRWGGDFYSCILPRFYFVNVIVKNYVTKVRILDEELMKERALLKRELISKHYNEYYGYSSKKWVRKYLNGVRRKETKIALKNYQNEDIYFDDNYKDAKWF